MKPGDIDWEEILASKVRGGYTLAAFLLHLVRRLRWSQRRRCRLPKNMGAIVSYDLNYRPSLWKSIGGSEKQAGKSRVGTIC